MKRKLNYLFRLLSGLFFYKWHNIPNGIYCFTYHRIGEASSTQFDPNVFSCTEKRFEQHLQFYKKHFEVISSEQLTLLQSQQQIDKRYAVITFDDGYLDNYETALPILLKYNLPATFFVTTDFVSQQSIPWWDEIAWMIQKTTATHLSVGEDDKINFSIQQANKNNLIHQVLSTVKTDKTRSLSQKVVSIAKQLGCSFKAGNSKKALFMTWQQVKDMKNKGMTIGVHTLSHPILSHLTKEQQYHELSLSKEIIETQIAHKVDSFAYPVGAKSCYNATTIALLHELDFNLAFVYEPGINYILDSANQFELFRFPIEVNKNCHRLKYALAFPE